MGKSKKENPIARVYKVADQGKSMLFISCIASTIGMLMGITPYLSVYFIARQLLMPMAGSDDASVILFWAVIAGVGIIANMLLTFFGSYGCHKVAFKLLYNYRIRVMEHIGRLPMGFFGENTTGSIQKTMDENIEKVEGF